MPVLESEEKIAPKSVLRYRPIGDGTPPTRKHSIATSAVVPVKKRASRPHAIEQYDDIAEWQYIDKPSVPENTPSTPGTANTQKPQKHQTHDAGHATSAPRSKPLASTNAPMRLKKSAPQHKSSVSMHPLLYLAMGMCAMLLLWLLLSSISGWFTNTLDTLRYGNPRTFQMDAWVGHNEQGGTPSHFIALNLKGRIEVIEFSGGDSAQSHVYVGPQLYGPNAALVPVTLTFADLNGDHKPDMIVNFQGSHLVFINDQGAFRPPLPAERASIERALQKLTGQ